MLRIGILARRVSLFALALSPLEIPEAASPSCGMDTPTKNKTKEGVRAHSCARRPARAVGTPTQLPIRPIFVNAFSSLMEMRGSIAAARLNAHIQWQFRLGTFSLGRISTMIQNFERTVPCYNHIVPLHIPPPPTLVPCCTCFYQQLGEHKKTEYAYRSRRWTLRNQTQNRPTKIISVRSILE